MENITRLNEFTKKSRIIYSIWVMFPDKITNIMITRLILGVVDTLSIFEFQVVLSRTIELLYI